MFKTSLFPRQNASNFFSNKKKEPVCTSSFFRVFFNASIRFLLKDGDL